MKQGRVGLIRASILRGDNELIDCERVDMTLCGVRG
jgi:hypothetical protein